MSMKSSKILKADHKLLCKKIPLDQSLKRLIRQQDIVLHKPPIKWRLTKILKLLIQLQSLIIKAQSHLLLWVLLKNHQISLRHWLKCQPCRPQGHQRLLKVHRLVNSKGNLLPNQLKNKLIFKLKIKNIHQLKKMLLHHQL